MADNDGVTLLAPSDAAWKEIGENDAAEFNNKPKLVDSIIGAHILKGQMAYQREKGILDLPN